MTDVENESTDQINSELRRLRELAERGDASAVVGGEHCMLWGVIVAVAALMDAIFAKRWADSDIILTIALLIVGFSGVALISRFRHRSHLDSSWRTTTMSTTWAASGTAIIAFCLGARLGKVVDPAVYIGVISVVFGIATAVTARLSKQPLILLAAAGWMVSGTVTFLLDSATARMLLLAVVSILFLCLPGLLLVRAEKAAT